jgi:D-alanyl-lipoteichoic acid acyltransferase DltB (MBOAT superfamily)
MLFNSYIFLFAFLPTALIGYFAIGPRRPNLGTAWLAGASLLFYAWWNPLYLPLLLFSAITNFLFGRSLSRREGGKGWVLAAAIAFNLGLLGYFKYFDFLVANLSMATGLSLVVPKIVLPLGISFFTFTQIAFLVDCYKGIVREQKFVHYLLFVTYFPHLIAGPILHHKEMMPQFASPKNHAFKPHNLVAGAVVLIIGLFKKVVLADGIAAYAGPVFAAAAHGYSIPMSDAWIGALAYTFQLYFDFSGYCDMAIGASLMFGIALPLNFNSPYKSTSIIEFWRRWHMTLSRFLRDYLYIPLGGNRHGPVRRYINLFVTMLLGGLWHGAGWTFVVWGALHGAYLTVNHAFVAAGGRSRFRLPAPLYTGLSWLVTFLAVVIGWVFFRADSFGAALRILSGMLGGPTGAQVYHAEAASLVLAWGWCLSLLAIAVIMPNSQEIMRPYMKGISRSERSGALLGRKIALAPSASWAFAIGLLLSLGLACLPQPTSFLYFNF